MEEEQETAPLLMAVSATYKRETTYLRDPGFLAPLTPPYWWGFLRLEALVTNIFLLLSIPVGAEDETEADLLPLVNWALTLRG
jgi:hypothetical protein